MATRMRRWAAAVLASGLLTGCANFFPPLTTTTTTSGTTSGDFVYVANQSARTVAAFQVGTSSAGAGTLTAVAGSPFAVSFSPTALALTPSNSFLYVAEAGGIYAFSVNTSTGVLTTALSGGAAAITLLGSVSLDISPDGQWLFALSGDNVTLTEYQINATTGALSAIATVAYKPAGSATSAASMVKVSPNGGYVFVALGTGGDLVFTLNTSTGALGSTYTQYTTGGTTTSDNALAVDSATSFLYVARSGVGGGIISFAIGANGALSEVAGSPFTTGAGPFSILLDSTGKFLYTANRTDGTISGFSIGTGGVLALVVGSPFLGGSAVVSLAREKSAKYVLAAAEGGSPDLSMYSFDAMTAGALDKATTAATGVDPVVAIAVVTTR